jgi:hypothetical protein
VATADRRIMNRENDFCRLKAMRLAIKLATPKLFYLSSKITWEKDFPHYFMEFHNIVNETEFN